MTSIPHRLFQQTWPEGEYRFLQLGYLVDDLVGAAERWVGVYGVGPFHVLPRGEVPCTYRGMPTTIDLQVAVAQAGPVQIELIQQHCDRPSIYTELAAGGHSRFHQLCTVTADYDGTRAHSEGLGYELASELNARGQRIAYFDTVDDFGHFTEVTEEVPGFLALLATIARTCAEWDGRDPVRLLTRDGDRTP